MKLFLLLSTFCLIAAFGAQAQCEADTTVYLTDFMFTPNEITIAVGQSVAFVNAEGTHNVDGTTESNPVSFFLEETEGNIDGVCMGTVTFDLPGVYTYTSSIGVQPELGMTGTIVVDAVTIADRMVDFFGGGELESLDAFSSAWAFLNYYSSTSWNGQTENPGWVGDVDLNGTEYYTVFIPNGAAIDDLMARINLSSFDMLAFYDMVSALKYHIVPGVFTAGDLEDGMELPTTEGQTVSISTGPSGAMVNDANIVYTDITAFNGVIHITDKILAPQGYPGATTWEVIVESPVHTYLEQALLSEGLNEALRGQPILNDNEPAEGPFTVFAPTDDAFIAFAEANGFDNVENLLDSQFIDDIVRAHLVESVYQSEDLQEGTNLVSYNNETINVGFEGSFITANTAPVVAPDLLAYNGVVHVLGEVMPFEFPDAEGTCGAWTVVMTSNPSDFGAGWQDASIHVYADGNEIAAETMTTNGTESFSVPVNTGSRIDVVYNDAGAGFTHGYSIIDQAGTTIFSSTGSNPPFGNPQSPVSVYGLNPCDPDPSCGLIEIVFSDEAGDGWYGGNMGVYSESGLEANIFFNPDFDGDGDADYIGFSSKKVMVTVDEGEVDFLVNAPLSFPTGCGYTILNPAGDVILEEIDLNQEPPSTINLVICEDIASNLGELDPANDPLGLYPNPVFSTAQITGLQKHETWQADVVSSDGKILYQQSGIGNGMLQVEQLPEGLYSVVLRTADAVYTVRLVKS